MDGIKNSVHGAIDTHIVHRLGAFERGVMWRDRGNYLAPTMYSAA